MDVTQLLATVVKVIVVAGAVIAVVPIMTWVERRGAGFIQLRLGPNRVGPFGLFQPVADGIKFFFKEDVVPPFVHKPTYLLAPIISFAAALLAFAVIPVGGQIVLGKDLRIPLHIADVDAGVLLLFAASGLGVYGVMLAGWASNNKYAQLGGLRSASQLISYELAIGLAAASVLVLSGTLRPAEIVRQQADGLWNVFLLPVGFLVLFVAGFAETNRAPFDLPEAESELVAGYHTEYSSMKFAMFFMSEYVNMVTSAALLVTLFLGGYSIPNFIAAPLGLTGNWLALCEVITFVVKVGFFLWVFVWVRWTLPRFRFDQLMRVGWKVLIPLAFLNVLWAGLLVGWGWVK
jgi:NADH-quinone oxidoreductase subunit H